MFNIFPATLIEGQKVPLIKNWQGLATSDPIQIKTWQDQFRERLQFFGIPCGATNNILVLDVDVKTNGWKTIQDLGLVIPDTLCQKTKNGGSHFFFKFDPTKDTGNRVGFLPGLDIRSTGGWVACWGIDADWSKPILDVPDWLYFYAAKKTKIIDAIQSPIRIAPDLAHSIFQASLQAIVTAPAGESNDTLNREAHRIGQLIGAGGVSREFAEAELFKAAKLRGKPDFESRATIKSGLDGGGKHPLTAPFTAPTPVIFIPDPPAPPSRWTPRYLTKYDLLNTSKLRKPQLFKDWSTEDICLTTADGGTGKTTLKLYEAICLALGDRFLGFDCINPGKTLFITGEDTDTKLAAMLGAIMAQMGLFIDSEENETKIQTILSSIVIKKDADLCLITKTREGFLYPNRDAMDKLLQAVEDIKPKMIVFDPIAAFWGSESALNDMNKAVTRFMSELVDRSGACVDMINHMGKASSNAKDMSQFAGRGGSGLPSHSRINRTLMGIPSEEYQKMTGADLFGDQTAMICMVSKFSDGSPLLNKPFIIIRDGYLFSRVTLSAQRTLEIEKTAKDDETIFNWVKGERAKGKYPTTRTVIAEFMSASEPMSEARIKRAIAQAIYHGVKAERVMEIQNTDLTSRDKMLTIVDNEGREI